MEIVDVSSISDTDAKRVFEKAPPCAICGLKNGLALGMITEARFPDAVGRLLLFCVCQLESGLELQRSH